MLAVSRAWRQAITDGRGGFTYYDGQWAPGWDLLALALNQDARTDLLLYNPATGAQYGCVTTGPGTFAYVAARGHRAGTSGAWMEARTAGVGAFETAAGSWTPGYALQLMQLDGNPAIDALLYQPATGGWHTGLRTGPGTYRSAFGGVDHAGVSLVTRVPATLHAATAPAVPMLSAAAP